MATYFVDENMLPVGRALAHVRADVVHPGHRALPQIPLGAKDPDWLLIVGSAGLDLVVVTRDRNIRKKPAEKELFDNNGVRALFLTGSKDMSKWDKFVMLVRPGTAWNRMFARPALVPGPSPGPTVVQAAVATVRHGCLPGRSVMIERRRPRVAVSARGTSWLSRAYARRRA